MYHRRIKFLIVFFIISVAIGLVRLAQLQLLERAAAVENIEKLGIKPPEIIPTLRGSITDRYGRILATDSPQFYIAIGYDLARFRDERFWESNALIRASGNDEESIAQGRKYWEDFFWSEIQLLDTILAATEEFTGTAIEQIEREIEAINNRMWRMRTHFAWRRNFPDSESIEDYRQLEPQRRLILEGHINDLAEMRNNWFMLAAIKPERVFDAQVFFQDIPEVNIIPQANRRYPYGSSAAQIIGWVNPQQRDNEIFASDELLKYEPDELSGYKGVEYVCEPLLRGRRGKLTFSSRNSSADEQTREFGQDVRLTLDIELQRMLENMLLNPNKNPNSAANSAAVIIDIQSGDILAAASLPKFDLSTARRDFGKLIADQRRPLEHKAFQAIYPPGSAIKPIILIAGLQDNLVTPQSTISCPLPAEQGWPRCWLQRRFSCHDDQFAGMGGNNAINATKGSCNIYFTKLSHRMNSRKLQRWLFDFGYGRRILQRPDFSLASLDIDTQLLENRNLREIGGFISNRTTTSAAANFEQVPPMSDGEKRWFGMGQGNLRVTVLQVANSFATIARGGLAIEPKLYANCGINTEPINLNLSNSTVKTVKDGLYGVVNERYGTAYEIFRESGLKEQGIRVYGKTGTTERPSNAWFAGFAEDSQGNGVAIAIVIEGASSGSHDAAPVAKQMLHLCIMRDYLKAAN